MAQNFTTSFNDGSQNYIFDPNQKRDLTDVLSVIVQRSPNFISNFIPNGFATNRKHEWLEEWVKPKTIAYSAAANGADGTVFTVADSGGWEIGDLVHIKNCPAIFEISAVTATTITAKFIAGNGAVVDSGNNDGTVVAMTASNVPTTAGILYFDSHPIVEGAIKGPNGYEQSLIEYNVTQIFRREVSISGTALATSVYGGENAIDHQIERALYRIALELNKAALFGVRTDRSTTSAGRCGGLYFFGAENGLQVNGCGNPLDIKMLNDAAMNITDAGANPTMILCAPLTCRIISAISGSNIQVVREDRERGAYVGQIVNDSTGTIMTVFSEPEMLPNEVWVIDPAGFGFVPMAGRALTAEDTTLPGFDGIRQTIQGELTLEFKNAKQRLSRIYNIENPEITLSSDLYTPKVIVKGGEITTTEAP